jgi:hypothetical protein
MAVQNEKLARSGKGVKDYATRCGSFVKATSVATELQKRHLEPRKFSDSDKLRQSGNEENVFRKTITGCSGAW